MKPRNSAGNGLAALLLVLAVAGCTPLQPLAEEQSPTAGVRAAARTVCLWHVESDLDLSCCSERVAGYERLIAEELHNAGFTVVDADRTSALWKQNLAEKGGYYDPLTGERDAARYARVEPIAAAALRKNLGCEAVVRPYLGIVQSRWSGTTAEWDGASDELVGGSWDWLGTVAALSLWLRIEKLPGNDELYFRSGGVQVLAGLQRTGIVRMSWAIIDKNRVLADDARNRKSIRLALEPLLKESGSVTP